MRPGVTALAGLLTDAGRDFLPVLFMIGGWARKHRGGGRPTRFFHAGTGVAIEPPALDALTRAPRFAGAAPRAKNAVARSPASRQAKPLDKLLPRLRDLAARSS